jgi:DNA-binding MarR family transcriptional regulator
MVTQSPFRFVSDFLGSAQIFTSTVNDLMEAELRRVTNGAVTFAQLKLLKMVSMAAGYTVSDVAEFLGVSTAAASRAVDRLVRRGLLERHEGTQDRRLVELSLTAHGHEIIEQYDAAADRVLRRVFRTYAPDALQQAGEFLDRLSLAIMEQGDEGHDVCFRCGIHFRDRCLLRNGREEECFFHSHRRPRRAEEGAGGSTGPEPA